MTVPGPAMLEIAVDPDTPVGTIVGAMLGDVAIAVVRHAEGWAAFEDECPHARCSLSRMGELFDGTVLVCNCHGSEFDLLTGEVLLEPAESPLTLLNVRASADHTLLVIELRA